MEQDIAAVRRFNRFFTQHVGALDQRFLGSELSLAEARLLLEIAKSDRCLASHLQTTLGMDAGFVSRVLRRFEARGWIARTQDGDARCRPIALTAAGRRTFEALDARQRDVVSAALARLGPLERSDLVTALAKTRLLLDPATRPDFAIRTFRPGDMGLIVARQALVYDGYGWSPAVERYESEVTAAFLRDFKPGREQCWIAEIDGVMAGSILLTDEGARSARLRLLYVEPFARRQGIGDALVATCLAFARDVGYAAIVLWTHTVLETARKLYAAHGFRPIETAWHEIFGKPEQGETWRLDLAPAGTPH